MIISDFCVFILSHGRPDKVKTFESLRRQGYTGKVVLVVSDDDDQKDKYCDLFPCVEIFNKVKIAETFDLADNFTGKDGVVVYARNACFGIARKLGFKYFMELDDDYTFFQHRIYPESSEIAARPVKIRNLDKVFKALLVFYKSINAASIAMAQGGDYIGGADNHTMARRPTLFRKCMNSFICSTDREFRFVGRINEDVNTYTYVASTGLLFFTVPFCSLSQTQSQQSAGGMTELYVDCGTYVKSFYSVMFHPSAVTVDTLVDHHGTSLNPRLHHRVAWNNAVPKIVSERTRKQ